MKMFLHQQVRISTISSVATAEMSKEELDLNQIPLWARDECAHLLVPLNRCRRRTYYIRGKCPDEMHAYEACLYKE